MIKYLSLAIFAASISTISCGISYQVFPHTPVNVVHSNLRLSDQFIRKLNLTYPENFIRNVLNNSYTFRTKSLAIKALLHKQYMMKARAGADDSFEPLDFIGNIALDYIVERYILLNSLNATAQRITDIKSAAVKNDALAFNAVRNRFDEYVIVDDKSIKDALMRYKANIASSTSYQEFMDRVQTRSSAQNSQTSSFMFKIFKSVAGAIYADSGFDIQKVDDVMFKFIKNEIDIIINRYDSKKKIH